jgi:hypothetical protein
LNKQLPLGVDPQWPAREDLLLDFPRGPKTKKISSQPCNAFLSFIGCVDIALSRPEKDDLGKPPPTPIALKAGLLPDARPGDKLSRVSFVSIQSANDQNCQVRERATQEFDVVLLREMSELLNLKVKVSKFDVSVLILFSSFRSPSFT